jgi:hypothetical protein
LLDCNHFVAVQGRSRAISSHIFLDLQIRLQILMRDQIDLFMYSVKRLTTAGGISICRQLEEGVWLLLRIRQLPHSNQLLVLAAEQNESSFPALSDMDGYLFYIFTFSFSFMNSLS